MQNPYPTTKPSQIRRINSWIRQFIICGVLFFGNGLTFGQASSAKPTVFQLDGVITGLPTGSQCTLTYHLGNPQNSVPVRTATVTTGGHIRFRLAKPPAPGIYWLTLSTVPTQPLPVIIGKAQGMYFQAHASHLAETMHWLDSPENQAFTAYRQQAAQLPQPADQQLVRNQFCAAHPDWFAAKWLRTAESPTGPTARAHFFDTFDLTDERLLRTDFFDQRLTNYLQTLTPPQPDSVIQSVDRLMAQAKSNPAVQQALANKIAIAYEVPMRFIGSDAVFVHLVDHYYLPRPDLWSAQTRQQFADRANALRPLLVGQTMPDLRVRLANGTSTSLHSVDARYTILYFYSLDCPHCQQHAPKLAAFQDKMQTQGVQVLAIAVEPDSARWQQFISTYQTTSLLNGLNPMTQAVLMKQFGIVEYPTDYILDRNKRILAKRIDPALFEQLINYLDKR